MGDATVMVTADGVLGGTLNGGYGVFAAAEGGGASTEYLTNAKGEKSLVHLAFLYYPSEASGGGHNRSSRSSLLENEATPATTDASPLFI